ncbi:MAG: phytoene/squalene synthase family protein [Alphaproteobacteria bacterium]|nr:phytoene/squalene synthase family protein [Alphaproteobacteria bacterium]
MMLSYCAGQVRAHDRDRYLTATLAPADRHEALFALYAFNLEVARTREMVSEPMVGQIRLQWWREAVDGIYANSPRAHEVVRPLAAAVERYDLSRAYFETLIDAREFDLGDDPPATKEDLNDYAKDTSSTLMCLALEILGPRAGPAHKAANYVGVAWGLTGLLRAVVFHARARRQYLPADLMREAGANPTDLFELRGGQALASVARDVASTARLALIAGRGFRRDVPRAAIPALLPGTLAEMYLRRMDRLGHDLFAEPIAIGQPALQFRLLRAALLGRY